MKIKFFIIVLVLFYSLSAKLLSDEVNFNAKKMEVQDNGNNITAYISETFIPEKNININSDVANYNKNKKELIFTDNVYLKDNANDLIIESDKIKYQKDKDIFYSSGDTKFQISGKYIIYSSNVYFDRNLIYLVMIKLK